MVELAVYGYWSAATAGPASSIRSSAAATVPQLGSPMAFRCETTTGSPASRPIPIASSTASIRRDPSSRMWLV